MNPRIDSTALGPPYSLKWIVIRNNGETRIEAHVRTQAEAWRHTCEAAEAIGMLGQGQFLYRGLPMSDLTAVQERLAQLEKQVHRGWRIGAVLAMLGALTLVGLHYQRLNPGERQ